MLKQTVDPINRITQRALIVVIKGYRMAISPYLGMRCRYQPSCSAYAIEALRYYGCARGCWKTFCRLLRCHPLSKGGYDPLPKKTKS